MIELDFVGEAYVGQKIFKTSDSVLLSNSRDTFTKELELVKEKVDMKIILKMNENPILEVSDKSKNIAKVKSDI